MPELFMIGGPNGAGKTTTATHLLPNLLKCDEYINADAIAAGLAPFKPETVAIQAGRLMIERLHELAEKGLDFAFETTMASRTFKPFLENCKAKGYKITAVFISLQSPELAKTRVASRVLSGGHHIEDHDVERRYHRGIANFFNLYIPISDHWYLYDNSTNTPFLIAKKQKNDIIVNNDQLWSNINELVENHEII